jgi:threonylcarbamoyladenosine tRNA methylthiotransferase MtaB
VPTAAFTTLGCKVNQYETQRILDDFEARGFAITEFTAPADVYVVNTCSVTQAAERKSRQMMRKVARQNPEAIVVMTGCYGEMAKIKGETVEEAALVVPNHQKLATLNHVLRAFPHLERELDTAPRPEVARPFIRRTRATVKVQDGCNVFCAFCSIPYTRKYMVSRPLSEVVAEVERLAEQGYKEVVITGVLVGAYGMEGNEETGKRGNAPTISPLPHFPIASSPDLADLLRRLTQVPGIERVRLSSIEPTQVTDRLLDAFAAEPKLCRHLHIPLQSGDSGVLRAMNRPYDQAFYLDRCRAAYARIPDLAITADIMVGFPGEDRPAFENTLMVVREVGYARAHLFRYSPRPNTPAADFPHQVSDEAKEARSRELAAACRETQQRFIQRHVGRTLDVLVEGREKSSPEAENGASGNDGNEPVETGQASGKDSGLLGGYTSNYIRVQFTGGSHLIGRVVRARLLEPTGDGAIGEVGGAHFGPQEAPPDADFLPMATFTASRVGADP